MRKRLEIHACRMTHLAICGTTTGLPEARGEGRTRSDFLWAWSHSVGRSGVRFGVLPLPFVPSIASHVSISSTGKRSSQFAVGIEKYEVFALDLDASRNYEPGAYPGRLNRTM
jgi:hypothetical protein